MFFITKYFAKKKAVHRQRMERTFAVVLAHEAILKHHPNDKRFVPALSVPVEGSEHTWKLTFATRGPKGFYSEPTITITVDTAQEQILEYNENIPNQTKN